MWRTGTPSRADLSADGRTAYDEIERVLGHVSGPYALLVNTPSFAVHAAHLVTSVRREMVLTSRQRHLIAATVGAGLPCRYVFDRHARLGRNEGISGTVFDYLAREELPPGLTADEEAVVAFVQELIRQQQVSDGTFDRTIEVLGIRQAVETAAAAGYYAMIAMPLNAFVRPMREEVTGSASTPPARAT
ncbi:MAG TPA: hypothetical protein VHG52_14705 [Thermomicrobiales bacterium]|nr:hypothetical protein [Thermomicrobiales bacterium]